MILVLQTWKQKLKEMKALAQGYAEMGLSPVESLTRFNLCFSSANSHCPTGIPKHRVCPGQIGEDDRAGDGS